MKKARLGLLTALVAGGFSACGGGGGGGGGGPTDTTPPAVESTSPGTGSVVDVGAAISFTFSEPMNRSSVEGAVTISPPVTCIWAWSSDSLTASCVHTAALPHSTHYSVTVGTGAKDAAGNSLPALYTFAFDSAPPPDTTPPTVAAVTPANGAAAVPAGAGVSVTFSEPVNQTSVTVVLAPSVDLGIPEWSADSLTVTFAPPAPLAYATAYTLVVNAADNAGNLLSGTKSFAFTTEPAPLPPEVVSATPAPGTAAAPVTANISLSFSLPMDRASVETAFAIAPAVTCAWSWSTDSTLATCTHADFAFNTGYAMELGTGATGQNGLHLAATFADAFHTAQAPDTTPPVVCPASGGTAPCAATSTTAPAEAATGISRTSNIVVSFSEPMDKASAQTAFGITVPSGHNAGVFTWNAAGDEMTYNPDVDFAYGDGVTWTVSTAAQDLAGNALAQAFTGTFRAIRTGTASLTSVAALDGYLGSGGSVQPGTAAAIAGEFFSEGYRGFFAFDLGALPATLTLITSASLTAYQVQVAGNPYGKWGVLSAESVDYGPSLDASDYSTAVLLTYFGKFCFLFGCPDYVTLSADGTIGSRTVLVTGKVSRDWAARATRGNRSQFRLNYQAMTTPANAINWAGFSTSEDPTNKPRLDVTYEYP